MTYLIVAILLGILAIVVLALSLRLLIGAWLLQWLRGSAGLLLVTLAVFIALAAWNLRSYQAVVTAKPIATLAFNRIEDRHYAVSLVDQSGNEQRYELDGEMWQLDTRVLRWTDTVAQLGFKPGYRVATLSGRYLSLEDEQTLPHSSVDLGGTASGLDVWFWLKKVNRHFSLLEAVSANVSYLPMADGAMYSVAIEGGGLIAHPLNERAKLATDHWQ
ncbi:MAG: cation/multidrug efflux pump [Verrucomicrobiaceae bacterium]|nr:cation/multidrug efflux pump [Verrucomicrobiaceae bacterium]